MARLRYDAVPNGGRWTVKFDGKAYGDFATQRDAARAAVEWAHDAGAKGHDAQCTFIDQTEPLGSNGRMEMTLTHRRGNLGLTT